MPDTNTTPPPPSLDDDDWIVIKQYSDGGYEVLIEGQNEGPNPKDEFENTDPDFYQVVYKNPWTKLIGQTQREPTAHEIHSALSLVTHPPAFVLTKAKMLVFQGLFMRLESISKQKHYCIVCGKNGKGASPAHDGDCVLYKALAIISASSPK